ncbi:MAG: hypothetical protein AAGK74_06655 [Chloroflexota bacterium]
MFRRWISIALILMVSLAAGAFALAQDDTTVDPDADDIWENDTTNVCYEDLAGQCQSDFDWEAGWWVQRVIEEDIGICDVPVQYRSNGACDDDGGSGGGNGLTVGRFTIILQGSPFAGGGGSNEINIAADDVDVSALGLDNGSTFIIYGNDNDNEIIGGSGDDEIYGFGGNDQIFGDPQNQDGNSGNDTIDGGDGNDAITGDGNGNNNSGNDVIMGGAGIDVINGDSASGDNNSGNDSIDGGDDSDVIRGDGNLNNSGNDTINGGAGNDLILGDGASAGPNTGTNQIDGGADNDTVIAGGSNTCSNVESGC